MNSIKFKVAAKTDIGIVRTNNEDNFQISWDLSSLPMRWVNNEVHQLGDKGCILVVADGMGGANAGEVASQIAIDTVKSRFVPDEITNKVISSPESINSFITSTITLADNNIKKYANEHPETKGMGTTIVIAWVLNGYLYIGWCGDSRAYLYNPAYGLVRLTKDHSYVQQLVDAGKLTEEEAFDFPDSNIITQCLSASPQKCHPDTLIKPIELSNEDLVLLCTDGLCGMIRDNEISSVLHNSDGNLTNVADSLVSAAITASGADNVTLCLFKVIGGLRNAPAYAPKTPKGKSNRIYYLLGALAIIVAGVLWIVISTKTTSTQKEDSHNVETVGIDSLGATKSDSIVGESGIQDTQESFEVTTSSSGEVKNEITPGNGNNILHGLNTGNIPSTEGKDAEVEDQELDVVSTPEIIVVKKPAGKNLNTFLYEFENNQRDFKKLNPEINYNDIKDSDEIEIKVYKKIRNNE